MSKLKPKIFPSYQELSRQAALFVINQLKKILPQKFVLGLATGSTQIGFRLEFIKLIKSLRLPLKNLYLVNLDEYWPLKPSHPCSFYQEMKTNLWKPLINLNLGLSLKNCHIPNGGAKNPDLEAARYQNLINSLGGITLQMLGVGANGHIAFNEKGSPSTSATRLVNLAPLTIKTNQSCFVYNNQPVPTQAITIGVSDILKSKNILLLASGSSKKTIIAKLIKSKPSKNLPASFLKNHPNVTFYIDKHAYG